MKRLLLGLACLASALFFQPLAGQGFEDLEMKNVDGEMVSLSDFQEAKGIVVIFSSIHCVYAKKYEDRILSLDSAFSDRQIQFVMVNSNDPSVSFEDSYESMVEHAGTKSYSFPFLVDLDHRLADSLEAQKTPETFVFKPSEDGLALYYHGPIDDNPLLAARVEQAFLKDALEALLAGQEAPPVETSVKGCSIKRMQ